MTLRIDPEQLERVGIKQVLEYLIDQHDDERMLKLQDYYKGEHDILKRQMADKTKPNNKLVNNIAGFITDTATGYFMGKPVSYSADMGTDEEPKENEPYLETLQDIYDYNDEQDQNAELAKTASINGIAYELVYTDEDARIRFAELPPEDVIYIENDAIDKGPALAVRRYRVFDIEQDEELLFYDVYTESEIITFEATTDETGKQQLGEIERKEHYFGQVPIVIYENNKERMGDFEGVLTLIDAYNTAQSDTANDFEYFTDAYLVLRGLTAETEDILKMKEQRVLTFDDKEAGAEWLIKDVNDTAIENYKNRLRNDIHALSKVPNLTDEQFAGNLSGVAISFKMWPFEQMTSIKERKFKLALQRRIELITTILNIEGNQWDWRDISITFSRNMPQSLLEIAQIVTNLKNSVSDITLLNQLPFIEDPQEELKRLEEQNKGAIDLDAPLDDEEVDEEVETEEAGDRIV